MVVGASLSARSYGRLRLRTWPAWANDVAGGLALWSNCTMVAITHEHDTQGGEAKDGVPSVRCLGRALRQASAKTDGLDHERLVLTRVTMSHSTSAFFRP